MSWCVQRLTASFLFCLGLVSPGCTADTVPSEGRSVAMLGSKQSSYRGTRNSWHPPERAFLCDDNLPIGEINEQRCPGDSAHSSSSGILDGFYCSDDSGWMMPPRDQVQSTAICCKNRVVDDCGALLGTGQGFCELLAANEVPFPLPPGATTAAACVQIITGHSGVGWK